MTLARPTDVSREGKLVRSVVVVFINVAPAGGGELEDKGVGTAQKFHGFVAVPFDERAQDFIDEKVYVAIAVYVRDAWDINSAAVKGGCIAVVGAFQGVVGKLPERWGTGRVAIAKDADIGADGAGGEKVFVPISVIVAQEHPVVEAGEVEAEVWSVAPGGTLLFKDKEAIIHAVKGDQFGLAVGCEVYGGELGGVQTTSPGIVEGVAGFPHDPWEGGGDLCIK